MKRTFVVTALLCLLAMPFASFAARADDAAASEIEAVKAKIWAKEQSIYGERATGGLNFYVDNASPNYIGWPPSAKVPMALTGLRGDAKRMVGLNKEKLTMQLMDFTMQGDTAVIYYQNHRTVKPDGTPVDQTFETIHVWVRAGDDWQIIGGMARLEPDRSVYTQSK